MKNTIKLKTGVHEKSTTKVGELSLVSEVEPSVRYLVYVSCWYHLCALPADVKPADMHCTVHDTDRCVGPVC